MTDRLGEYARNNRNNPTEPEIRLWRVLSASKFGGLKFRRQHRIQDGILDFFCPQLNLGIEVDGDTHDFADDAASDAKLFTKGIHVIRFTNGDVMANMDGVAPAILSFATSLPLRWAPRRHPNPSPEGEGL